MHTFEDGCDSHPDYKANYGGKLYYYMSGDGVKDTPAHRQGTRFEKEINDCWIGQELNTCDDNTPGVDAGPDPVDNVSFVRKYTGVATRPSHFKLLSHTRQLFAI